MTMRKYLVAGSAMALAIGLTTPAAAQEVCMTSTDGGATDSASGSAAGSPSLACGAASNASGAYSTALGPSSTASGDYSTAIGASASATNTDTAAIGDYSTASGVDSTAVGSSAEATGDYSTAVGAYAAVGGYESTAVGAYARATGDYSTAVGAGASDGGFTNSVALGSNTIATANDQVNVGNRTIGGLADGVASDDAATVGQMTAADDALQGQIDTNTAAIAADSAAIGLLDDRVTQNEADIGDLRTDVDAHSTAIASLQVQNTNQQTQIDSNTAAVTDLDNRVTGNETDIAALQTSDTAQDALIAQINANAINSAYIDINSAGGTPASATGTDAMAFGNGAVATHNNSIALGAGSVTTADNQVNVGGRTISGLADGALSATSTDAVTGAQLFDTNNRVSALESIALDFDQDLRDLDRKLDGSTAVAIAMSGNAFLPDKSFNVTGNVGYYQGAVAGAVQLGAMVSPNTAFNAGVATNFNKKGGVGARAGFTFGW